ncbi:MAG: DUF58 domain-containing protein [Candidatus Altiarchaeota archaeon]
MIDTEFLENLKNLNFIARKKITSVYIGSRSSVMQGRGLEIFDHREYFPGDDFRAIDWKLYGRTEKLFIRRFEEEKNLTLHVLIDSSRSMDFSLGGKRKFDYAESIAMGFTYLAMIKYEKFSTALYAEKIREVTAAKKGKKHFFSILDLLNKVEPYGQSKLKESMEQYRNFIKTKSFVVLISDFLEELSSIEEGLYRLAKNSKECIAIQILDPSEIYLKWNEDIKFEDLETYRTEVAYISPGFREEYRRRIKEHIFKIQKICDDLDIEFFLLTTDMPLFDSFLNILRLKKKVII